MRSILLASTALALAAAASASASAQTTPSDGATRTDPTAGARPSPQPADGATKPSGEPEIIVTARRLDLARDRLLPSLGANRYTIDRQALEIQPQGGERTLARVLEQTPGVTQDNFGQVHVRNEHANLQYRINGVILPEPISGFGQVIDTRIADSISLITGALPAQYGYRTAGVVDIKTRTGAFDNGGVLSVYGGSYDTIQPSAVVQGSSGGFNGFGSFTYTHTGLGIENPIGRRATFNNDSDQYKGFGYLSQILSSTTRLTGVFGINESSFEIPSIPGQEPAFTYNGQTRFDSSRLNERQREKNYYGAVALQFSSGPVDLQFAPYFRLSRERFIPDVVGDLLFNGSADRSRLSSDLFGVQADGRFKIASTHTLRAGFQYQREITHSDVSSLVFPGFTSEDGTFVQTSEQPLRIDDSGRKLGTLYGFYLQDEWTPFSKLTINVGGRFDRVEAYTHEQQFSPRVNAVYTFSDKLAAHIGYARNFTPPPQELVSQQTVGLFDGTVRAGSGLQSDPVRAERETLYDVGVNATPFAHLTLTVDAYYKHKRELLDEGQFGEALVLAPFNYARGYNYGVEVGGNYRRGPLNLYANIAAAEQRGNELVSSQFFFAADEIVFIKSNYIFTDHTQKVTGSAGASYRLANRLGALTLASDLIYGSGLRRDPPDGSLHPNGSKLPAYVQVNLGLSERFSDDSGLKGWELRFDVVNLLDRTYQIRDGSGVGISASQYGTRQSFYGGIAKRF